MQTTILERVDGTVPKEPAVMSSIREDPRIRSIVVIRNGNPARNLNQLVDASQREAKTFEEHMADVLTFLVSDLLSDTSYSVTQRESFYELVFPGRQEQIHVAVELGSDLTEIANSITNHLADIIRSN